MSKPAQITKLSDTDKSSVKASFLKNLGTRLKDKRNEKSISQATLAECLEIDGTTLSKYENGERDMNVSMLPLFSIYCKFPLSSIFPLDESKALLSTFSKAVTITVQRDKRQQIREQRASIDTDSNGKLLKAHIYDIDGEEVRVPVSPVKQASLKEQYKKAELHTEFPPYSEEEFLNYICKKKADIIPSIVGAGQFLNSLGDAAHKETLKNAVTDYIIDELVINKMVRKHPDEASRRAYAYYRSLYLKEMNGN